ncbi:MAG: YggS family pyridoxal phosphate-dependent enzyme [Lachnospiraceae bacterium]|jgi:pyridoxal phosphate enzyme (YggS family)|nr:YggS family pyridoxal phosphate-dependent enzyme [Lachnospiraceae bacterium]MDD7702759.1 YggS family pyridoxal phosphate-dependent enzyme [Lachnospiraceae bacterium]MDY3302395.1 YggS family pyridoxal phosphate-dependent enzyme [Lachnospiraceae bacterium]
MADIKENLANVRKNIEESCKKVGRDVSEVTLITVSKTKPLSDLRIAYEEGSRDFGENKVQELVSKIDEMPSDVKWHLIGHLQRNKVKYIAGKVAMIHSVDSYRLAEEINVQAKKNSCVIPILIEINIAGEDTKFGIKPEEAEELIREISELENVKVSGLMTIAPNVANPEENRAYFKAMKDLFVDISSKNIDNVEMKVLSMGMTNDYTVAVEEGATMIRVGTGIFGARDYSK